MLKIISFFLLSVFLFGDILKIYAKKAVEKNNLIYLQKPYLIYNDELYIQANRAVVKDKQHIKFIGNVVIFYNNSVMKANKVEVVTKNNIKINYSFYYDNKLDLWFKSKIAFLKKQKIIYFKNGIFSSCCIKNPDWYIYAKKGSFNKETKSIKLYNLILYIHNTPVFYLPVFFSSLNKQRRSGFLRPYVGYSVKEGFLYSQPIYFATSIRNDLQITPTIRTKRGRGIYSTFRFVDSPYSFGILKGGVFFDKDKYFRKYNLAHKKHFGYEFNYKRDKIFGNDKLYMEIKYANDVDYFYLNPRNYTFDQTYLTDKIITSKINYLKEFNNSVIGIYNRYFINTSLLNNGNTLQVLPQFNYHYFENKKGILLNSFDYNFYNYYSEKGNRYFLTSFNLPIGISTSLFNNYLNVKISEIIKGEDGNFYNSSIPPSYYLNTYTQFKIFSSFTKKSGFVHVISPEIILNIKNYNKSKVENSTILNYSNIQNSISFNLFQIFSYKDIYFEHTFHQFYNMEDKKSEPMENQINFNYNNFSFDDDNKFDWELKRVIYNASIFSYYFSNNSISISHIYQYSPKLKTLDIKLSRDLNKYKKIFFEYNYDLINRYPKFWLFGINLNKKCWQYNFSFKKSLTPVLKENGISYNVDYVLSFFVNFYPIGGLKQSILIK